MVSFLIIDEWTLSKYSSSSSSNASDSCWAEMSRFKGTVLMTFPFGMD